MNLLQPVPSAVITQFLIYIAHKTYTGFWEINKVPHFHMYNLT